MGGKESCREAQGPGAVRVNPFEAAKSHEVAVKPFVEGFANGASKL